MRTCEDIRQNIDRIMGSLATERFRAFENHMPYIQKTMDLLSDDESRRLFAREITYLMLFPCLKGDLPYRFGPMSREYYQKLLHRGLDQHLHAELVAPPEAEYCLRQWIVHTFYNEQYAYKDKVSVAPGDICLDIGAFVGDTAIWMLDKGARYVFSFEIDRKLQDYLFKNMERNNYGQKFRLVPHAVADKSGAFFYEAHPRNPGAGRLLDRNPESGHSYEIYAITLDEFCARNFIRPNFIKMDIEGAEPEAIAGAQGIIARHRPKFAICIYHKTEHRWQLPLSLKEICEDYEFYIKKSSYDCETVLLGRPAQTAIYPVRRPHAFSRLETCPSCQTQATPPPPQFNSYAKKEEYFKSLAGKYSRIILTGFLNSRHTHKYIHAQWQRFLHKMGVECLWIDHPNQIAEAAIPGSLIVVPDDHLAKIYPLHLTFNKEYSYLLHQGKYIGQIPAGIRYLNLLEYRNIFSDELDRLYAGQEIRNFVKVWRKPHILMQPWGCPLLQPEFMPPCTARSSKKIYFIGAKWSGNEAILLSASRILHQEGFELVVKAGVSASDEAELMRQSYCAISPGAAKHGAHDYLTCKVFKNIAYGRMAFTDINAFKKILGKSFIPISSFRDAVKTTALLPEETEKGICSLQQQRITEYTYLDMWINILFYLEEFNR